MPMIDRAGSDTTKVTASLVRDARSLLRRADKLACAVAAIDDTAASRAANEARDAVDRLVHELVSVQQRAQRSARDAIRKVR
jgi:hypothetical protein